jgi:hypothetical protein
MAAYLSGAVLAACQKTPSVAEVTEACQRGNATVTSVEIGEAYVSTAPERGAGVPPNVTIYPVKVTYQLPSLPGSDPKQTVTRNVYENVYEELVCD